MINENILSLFKCHSGNPSYSILITDITQNQECNQDNITFTVYQINKDINDIITDDVHVSSRNLTIQGNLDIGSDNLYGTKLIGYVSGEKAITEIPTKTGVKEIEVLDTKLKEEIVIEYNKEYEKMPKIFINTENSIESLYGKMEITQITENKIKEVEESYITEEGTEAIRKKEEEKTYYTGAILKFNGLKRKKEYPIIGIIIVGD